MSKKSKFFVFCFLLTFILATEIIYLLQKDNNENAKLKFVRLTGATGFAFYQNTPYLRHPFGYGVYDLFHYHPGFRESEPETFTYTGLAKIYE